MQFLFHLKLLTAWQAHKFLDYLIEKMELKNFS